MKSALSRTIVAGVAIAATAGWVGVQSTPATLSEATVAQQAVTGTIAAASVQTAGVQTGVPGVRDRSAWQPSPIPSKTHTEAIAPAAVPDDVVLALAPPSQPA
jgi:hypothetical protein